MQEPVSIRILEKENNRRGDLFGRLMADLFVALGYEQPRLNIHKSGRELDLSADHRLEPRRAIAECKATAEPIGGDNLNKFVGILDVERRNKRPVTGYFISLGGFKETAIEQEKQRRKPNVLLTGAQVVSELVRGRILVPKERAIELAGRYCKDLDHLTLDPAAELLAHERGWIWAIYYTQGKDRTHFALIHSDGTPLARALADEVIAADRVCGGTLHDLSCLNPPPSRGLDTYLGTKDALAAYQQYLENECGFIQLDGLPADTDIGSRRLRLENLFVPLHLDLAVAVEGNLYRQTVGTLLAKYRRLALLAAPGGGKSTLIKSVAVSYIDYRRHKQIADDLPQGDWLPLFFRCRELRNLARGSFAELLESLSRRELVRQHATTFLAYVERALLDGRVLLLVDGLDEISDPGDRAAFVCTLRTALQAYPGITLIVTSREAGFRNVAAHLAPVCMQATLSPFNENDIRRLTVAWHREVVGDMERVRADAEQLAATIVRNDRIKRLAVNPLLLTTLLLVKRWVGSLPTRRSVLYGKAVEVLLMTWNTEGHEPIPDGEALPQLCYVASAMMLDGIQKISRPRLSVLLQEARNALPLELGYVKETVDQFIHRVEDRSSLLMMSGHDVEDGQLVEFFEFRHLTFQEFLTARGMVEGWHPRRTEWDTLVSVLEPHLKKEEWREVIPLAAALGGKATEALVQRLTEMVRREKFSGRDQPLFLVLGNCLADEAAVRPETIRAALYELVRRGSELKSAPFTSVLARGRYGTALREEAGKAFLAEAPESSDSGQALAEAVWWQTIDNTDSSAYLEMAENFRKLLDKDEVVARCEGALGSMYLCSHLLQTNAERKMYAESLCLIGTSLLSLLFSDNTSEQFAASWALEWLGACRVWSPPSEPDVLGRLFMLSLHSPDSKVRSFTSLAIVRQPLAPRDSVKRFALVPCDCLQKILEVDDEILEGVPERLAVLIGAWHLRMLEDAELARRTRVLLGKQVDPLTTPTIVEFLEYLGERA